MSIEEIRNMTFEEYIEHVSNIMAWFHDVQISRGDMNLTFVRKNNQSISFDGWKPHLIFEESLTDAFRREFIWYHNRKVYLHEVDAYIDCIDVEKKLRYFVKLHDQTLGMNIRSDFDTSPVIGLINELPFQLKQYQTKSHQTVEEMTETICNLKLDISALMYAFCELKKQIDESYLPPAKSPLT